MVLFRSTIIVFLIFIAIVTSLSDVSEEERKVGGNGGKFKGKSGKKQSNAKKPSNSNKPSSTGKKPTMPKPSATPVNSTASQEMLNQLIKQILQGIPNMGQIPGAGSIQSAIPSVSSPDTSFIPSSFPAGSLPNTGVSPTTNPVPGSIAGVIPGGNSPDASAISSLLPTIPNTEDSSSTNSVVDSNVEAIKQSNLPGVGTFSSVYATGSLPNTVKILLTNPGSGVLPIFPGIAGNGIDVNPSEYGEAED